MPRYSAGARASGVGSTTLPSGSLYAGASIRLVLREVGFFNASTTAVALKLARLTTTGTQGSGLTEAAHLATPHATSATGTAFNTHSVAPTLGDDLGYRHACGAAVGSGIVFTFGDSGIWIPSGTSNGIGIIVDTGTGQTIDYYFVWDE